MPPRTAGRAGKPLAVPLRGVPQGSCSRGSWVPCIAHDRPAVGGRLSGCTQPEPCALTRAWPHRVRRTDTAAAVPRTAGGCCARARSARTGRPVARRAPGSRSRQADDGEQAGVLNTLLDAVLTRRRRTLSRRSGPGARESPTFRARSRTPRRGHRSRRDRRCVRRNLHGGVEYGADGMQPVLGPVGFIEPPGRVRDRVPKDPAVVPGGPAMGPGGPSPGRGHGSTLDVPGSYALTGGTS